MSAKLPIGLAAGLHTMLTISIIFAFLVALWGFSGTLASHAKRGLVRVKPAPRPASARAAAPRSPARPAASQPRTARRAAAAGH
jgi:hypothetical protein